MRAAYLALLLALGGCTTAQTPAPQAVASASAMTGSWSGRLPGGSTVQIDVPATGLVRYLFQGQRQSISDIRVGENDLEFRVGRLNSLITLDAQGAYTYTERGQVTRAALTKG